MQDAGVTLVSDNRVHSACRLHSWASAIAALSHPSHAEPTTTHFSSFFEQKIVDLGF
jgi:hypothetical protein